MNLMKTFDRNHTRAFESGRLQNQPPASPVDIDRLNDFLGGSAAAKTINSIGIIIKKEAILISE
jgi:hypothetical protein